MQLLSFDIEIAEVFDLRENEDLEKYAQFHVAVASTVIHGGEARVWFSADEGDVPLVSMTREKAGELLQYLRRMQANECMVCAWNGLGFDLRWLGHSAEDMHLAADVALNCYDPMFQFFNQRGFPISLESVAKGMGIKQRKLMEAAEAPRRWRAGNHKAVMDYVLGDSEITNQIVAAILERRELRWITRDGTLRKEPLPILKTVQQVLREPEPDQSWMSTPMPRSKFHHWLPNQQ
jgi:hypothetical protein